jgi:hypothetical protein
MCCLSSLLLAGCSKPRENETVNTVCQGQLVAARTYANGVCALELKPVDSPPMLYTVRLAEGSAPPTQADAGKWFVLKCATWGDKPKSMEWTLVPWTQ